MKHTKKAKNRLDRYYQLAKEQGYRARSAFKLIQLASKFHFLQQSRSLLDLCAAPGGWLQVAVKFLPFGCPILGIDLVPIKPIRGVKTIQADITSDKCRSLLQKEMQGKKFDTILHDGAPNMSGNWVKDAYIQNELTLRATALACEFLELGGCYITKVFRSSDYTSLLWMLQFFFDKVQATKPQSSRNVSAEIYILCFGYKAPLQIDPKLFDPKYVFAAEGIENEQENVTPGTKKALKGLTNLLKIQGTRNRSGYEAGDEFRTASFQDFMESKKPAELLLNIHQLVVSTPMCQEIQANPFTTDEIMNLSKDIRVLGKADLKILLKWRYKILREVQKSAEKNDNVKKIETIDTDVDDEEKIEKECKELELEKILLDRRRLRKLRRRKAKLDYRRAMSVGELGLGGANDGSWRDELDPDANNINLQESDISDSDSSDTEYVDRLEKQMNLSEAVYKALKEKLPQKKTKLSRRMMHRNAQKSELDSIEDALQVDAAKHWASSKSDNLDDNDGLSVKNITCDEFNKLESIDSVGIKAARWFDQKLFRDVDFDMSEVEEMRNKTITGSNSSDFEKKIVENSGFENGEAIIELPSTDKQLRKKQRRQELEKEKRRNMVEGADDFDRTANNELEIVPMTPIQPEPKRDEIPEIQALGSLMINKKNRMDLLDGAYNRYAFDDEDLPDWFLDDENKHCMPQLPVTKELMHQYKRKIQEINARPIRKAAEAQARKKKRQLRLLAKIRQKAEIIADSNEHSESTKTRSIRKLVNSAKRESKSEHSKTYIVTKRPGVGKTAFKKAAQSGKSSSGNSVKGKSGSQYKMVDRRLKKDKRAAKAISKRCKHRKGSRRGFSKSRNFK